MMRILIVDDDQNNRLVLSDCLESEYALIEAEDGKQAIEVTQKLQPDLILLDVQMPVMDGHEALRKLKGDETTRHIPVIMVTALDMDSQVAMFLDDGAVDHVAKPFSTMVVRARVRAALRHKMPQATGGVSTPDQRGRIYSFIGAKGGVGTTTVALNMATLLASRSESVIAAEVQPFYGTFGPQLKILPTDNLASLVREQSDKIAADNVANLLVKHKCGFQVLLGPQITEGYLDLKPDLAESIVQNLSNTADCVVLDLPSQPNEAIQGVLRQSDFVCLVLERDTASLRSALILLDLLHSRGVSVSSIGAVVVNRTRATSGTKMSLLQQKLPCRVMGVVPPEPEMCERAVADGVPVVFAEPHSDMSSSFMQISESLLEGHVQHNALVANVESH